MRALGALAVVTALGCVSSKLGPGVLDPHWQEPPRDPDPTRNPVEEQMTSPWVPEGEAWQPETPAEELAARAAATIAASLAGAIPALVWYGSFEEDPNARERARRSAP